MKIKTLPGITEIESVFGALPENYVSFSPCQRGDVFEKYRLAVNISESVIN